MGVQNLLNMQNNSFNRWWISQLVHDWDYTHWHTHKHTYFDMLSPCSSVVSLLKSSSYTSVSLKSVCVRVCVSVHSRHWCFLVINSYRPGPDYVKDQTVSTMASVGCAHLIAVLQKPIFNSGSCFSIFLCHLRSVSVAQNFSLIGFGFFS